MKKVLFFILIIAVLAVACFIGCDGCGKKDVTIKLDKQQLVLKKIGATEQLTAKVSNDGAVEWASLDEEIATVTQSGLVTALSNGVTQIAATSGGVSAICTVEVNEPIIPEPGLAVSFAKTSVSLNATIGETYTLLPIVKKNNQVVSEGVTFEWTSSAPEKASVSNGVISAIANTEQGEPAVITCKVTYGQEWAEARFYVTVKDDVDIVFLTTETKFYTTDTEINIPVSIKINGVSASVTAEYSSINTAVAKIDGGKIIPVGAGKTTILVNVNGQIKPYEITVKQKFFISTAEQFMNISMGNAEVAYELTQNVELNNSHVQKVNVGGTGLKTENSYFIESFKAELIGNGYTVRYVYTAPYDGVNVTPDKFIGFFKNIESTALIRQTAFVGEITFDYPHQIAFACRNDGVIENCFIRTSRRQLTNGTGWDAHYNEGGSIFETQHGTIKDSIIYGEFYVGEYGLADSGDNLVSYGTKNVGVYDNVAFISKFSRIGNHLGANWSKAMGKDELKNLVYYTDVNALANKQGKRITNPNDSDKYAEYVRTECNSQQFDSAIWQINEQYVSINGKKVWEKANVGLNRDAVVLVDNVSETFNIAPSTEHLDKRFSFISTDTSVATVNAQGQVEFVGAGQTNVIIKHQVTNQTAILKVYAYSSVTTVNTKEGLLSAMRNSTASTAISLTADVEITQSDFIEVANPNATSGATKTKFAYAVDSFKGALIGNGHKITWLYNDSEGFVQSDKSTWSDKTFRGVVQTLESTAIITQTVLMGESVVEDDNQASFITNVYGTIESCYIDAIRRQIYSKSGNWEKTGGTFEKNEGLIANSIIVSDAYKAGTTRVSAKLVYKGSETKGVFKNVALIQYASKNVGTRNSANDNSPLYDSHMQGLVWYSSFSDIVEQKGLIVSNKDRNMVYEFTAQQSLQTLGDAWTIDQTAGDESIKLGNTVVWQKVVMIGDEADFIQKLSTASAGTTLKLSRDLSFDTDDFTVVNNGGTGTKTKDAYLVKSFSAILNGDGHKITWIYDKSAGFVSGDTSTISPESFKGLIETVNQGAVISNVIFVGESIVDMDEQPTFIDTNNGTIENCYIEASHRQLYSKSGNWQSTGGIIRANDGVINSCVIFAKGYNGRSSTTLTGTKLVYRGGTTGKFTNIAFISADKKIASRNAGNEGYLLYSNQLENFVYYSSLTKLISADGEIVTNPNNGSSYTFTGITSAQNIGSCWSIDSNGIKLNGIYAYQA